MQRIVWAPSLERLRDRVSRSEGPPCVVLTPDDPRRAARWENVLSWYEQTAVVTPPSSAAPRGDHVVAVVGEGFEGVASAYARIWGRRWLVFPNVDEAIGGLRDLRCSSVMIVAEAATLVAGALLAIGDALEVPWSLVPALDPAGLSFSLAKMSLVRDRPLPEHGLADGLWRRLVCLSDGSAADIERMPTASRKRQFLSEMDWGSLAIIAHGRGGHLDFDDVVVCSLLGDVEKDARGRRIDGGCRTLDAEAHCKRGRAGATVVRLDELKAQRLLLMSCLSALAPYEQYPSSTSGVAAFCEGFAASGILATGLIPQFASEPVLALSMLEEGSGLGEVVGLLNRARAARGATDLSFVALGEPCGMGPRVASGRAVPLRSRAVALPEVSAEVPRVVMARADVIGVVVGPRDCSMVLDASAPPVGPPLDRGADWLRIAASTGRVMQRADECARVESLWAEALEHAASTPPRALDLLDGVTNARREVLRRGRHIANLLVATDREGWWRPDFDELYPEFVRAVVRWDRCMACLIATAAHTRGLDQALTHGLVRERTRRCGCCPVCATVVFEVIFRDVLQQRPDAVVKECLNCGALGHEGQHGGTIDLSMPRVLRAGSSHELTIRVRWSEEDSPEEPMAPRTGYIAVSIADLTDGEPYLAEVFDLSLNPRSLQLRLPEGTQSYLKSVTVALVSEMSIATRRRCVPSLPSSAARF